MRRSQALRRTVATPLLAAALALGLASPAYGSGVKGDPQPELAPFSLTSLSGGLASGTALTDGTVILAEQLGGGSSIVMCKIPAGSRKCSTTVKLKPYLGDTFEGTPQVFSSGADVWVVAEDCCHLADPNPGGGAVEFLSTDGGATYGKLIKAGSLQGVDAGAQIGDQIVVGQNDNLSGTMVQALAEPATSTQTSIATLSSSFAPSDIGVADYKAGALVAADDGTDTKVWYAPSGSDFNSSSAYSGVGSISGQTLSAVSGSALLTDVGGSLTGGERLRFFDGTSFGSSHVVPEPKNPDDGYFAMQEVGSTVHVFFVARRDGYKVYSETTKDGVHWTKFVKYASAILSSQLVPVLGSSGAGILYESDAKPLIAQEVLNAQRVSVALARSTVPPGTSTKLSGHVSPKVNGTTVTLERESGGLWYSVSTTKESSTGTFSFTIPGKTETYRAVASLVPGFDEYGYSKKLTLTAT